MVYNQCTMVQTRLLKIIALSVHNGLFSYCTMGTVGVISGQLLRKVELAKIQDRLMDGSES